jgi:uncharacterized delta-60 repeat protein
MRSSACTLIIASLLRSVCCVCAALAPLSVASARDGDTDLDFAFFGYDFQYFPGGKSVGALLSEPVLLADGKLLVSAPQYTTANNADFGVIRLKTDGSVDATFGTNGAAVLAFDRSGSGMTDGAAGMAVQADGKIVVTGFVSGDATTGIDMGVARFTSDGKPDSQFGNGGKVVVPFNLGDCAQFECDDFSFRTSLQTDGRILVAGFASTSSSTTVMAVARLTTAGLRDSTFDGDGRVTIDFGGDVAAAGRVRQLADGQHIVVAGYANQVPGSGNFDFALARLDAAGQLDPGFGVGGKLTYAFDVGGNNQDVSLDFVELAGGKLLVCGAVAVNNPANADMACVRFTATGQPDPTFVSSLVPFDIGGGLADGVYAFAVDAKKRIVLAGSVDRDVDNADFGVARLLPNGTIDDSFGTGGRAHFGTNPLFGVDRYNAATGVLIQPDEKIVVTGYAVANDAGDQQFQVMRLNGNDTIFFSGTEND